MSSDFHRYGSQAGTALVFSLVILAVVTLLSVASMRSSNLELKMAASARDRAVAFQAAEAALAQAEKIVLDANYTADDFICRDSASSRCFDQSCTNGLCFNGDLAGAVYRDDCKIAKPAAAAERWPVQTFWTDNGANLPKVQIAKTDIDNPEQLDDETLTVPYMVEFLCYVPRDGQVASDEK